MHTTLEPKPLRTWHAGPYWVEIARNPDHDPAEDDVCGPFLVTDSEDSEYDASDLGEALAWAKGWLKLAKQEQAEARRAALGDAAEAIAGMPEGEERDACLALVRLMAKGKAGAILEAVKAVGLV